MYPKQHDTSKCYSLEVVLSGYNVYNSPNQYVKIIAPVYDITIFRIIIFMLPTGLQKLLKQAP